MTDTQSLSINDKILAVAPMMAWTDRHCRYLHRLFSKNALLFTEMISSSAVVIGKQTNLLDYSDEEHPLAVQFGGNDPKELAKCAEIAKTLGIKIYTIGVGKRGKAPFLVDSIFGKRLIYQDVDIDEEALNKISEMTDAKYFRATDLKSLKDIYKQIDLLEKSEVKSLDHSEYKELFHYFLIPGLILLLTEIIFSNSFLRRLP